MQLTNQKNWGLNHIEPISTHLYEFSRLAMGNACRINQRPRFGICQGAMKRPQQRPGGTLHWTWDGRQDHFDLEQPLVGPCKVRKG